jgi:hypothetical protein
MSTLALHQGALSPIPQSKDDLLGTQKRYYCRACGAIITVPDAAHHLFFVEMKGEHILSYNNRIVEGMHGAEIT